MSKKMAELFTFQEGDVTVSGPKEELLELADWIEGTTDSTEMSNKWCDLAYSIRVNFDEAFQKEVNR